MTTAFLPKLFIFSQLPYKIARKEIFLFENFFEMWVQYLQIRMAGRFGRKSHPVTLIATVSSKKSASRIRLS